MHYMRKISLDILLFSCCYATAFLIRFDMSIPSDYVNQMIISFPMVILIRISIFFFCKIYRNDYTYFSVPNVFSILKAASLSSILITLIHFYTSKVFNFPISVLIIDWYLAFISICGIRYLITRWRQGIVKNFKNRKKGERVLIIGAGDAGESIIREIKSYRRYNYLPVGLIDDNPQKQGKIIQGVKVLGTSKNIPQVINNKRINEKATTKLTSVMIASFFG